MSFVWGPVRVKLILGGGSRSEIPAGKTMPPGTAARVRFLWKNSAKACRQEAAIRTCRQSLASSGRLEFPAFRAEAFDDEEVRHRGKKRRLGNSLERF
jgi:hypothetical protein